MVATGNWHVMRRPGRDGGAAYSLLQSTKRPSRQPTSPLGGAGPQAPTAPTETDNNATYPTFSHRPMRAAKPNRTIRPTRPATEDSRSACVQARAYTGLAQPATSQTAIVPLPVPVGQWRAAMADKGRVDSRQCRHDSALLALLCRVVTAAVVAADRWRCG